MTARRFAVLSIIAAVLPACAAIQATPTGEKVQIITEKPAATCNFLGEAVGSQGNFITGRYTPNENLLIGSRNDLRNKAAALGGNVVQVIETYRDHASLPLRDTHGTTNMLVLGRVYRCD
ncbi:DUF4156 domain-containing protein [Candidatus Methylospira mobilis]|uniref:DUF4156 domain-containing protein n=1 Tax=Candidatus Methylospira mobilis TaxID=1808979 RepID=A0A5Q0BK48_9GAMM|nr:DUF4156 domain-containing protein [Candidatus Methylospira mobilis]QFY44265.1 DUF4156 domain-containing protein [Candidatus Methylospira mobilis]